MRKGLKHRDAHLKGHRSSSDTDAYTVSELDLLNLRVNYPNAPATWGPSQRGSGRFISQPKSAAEIQRLINSKAALPSPSHYKQRASSTHSFLSSNERAYLAHHTNNNINQSSSPDTSNRQRHRLLKSKYTQLKTRRDYSAPPHQLPTIQTTHYVTKPSDRGRCYPDLPAIRMAQRTRANYSPEKFKLGTDSEESNKKAFPFQPTPSGNLKIVPNQVVFESKKVSVLVADPHHTKVNVQGDLARSSLFPIELESYRSEVKNPINMMDGDRSGTKDYTSSADEYLDTLSDVLTPEIKLERLGINNTEPFNWANVEMHSKTNMFEELNRRITNYILADCNVYIGNEEFSCHLIVLQCYAKFFENVKDKKVDLTKQKAVTPKAFATIYGWMITHQDDSHKLLCRDNVLDLFAAAKFLGIKELEEQCWMFVDSKEVFDEDTAFLLYLEAKVKGHTDVMQLMIPRIRRFFLTLVSSQDYLDLNAEEVCALLSSNYIYINCEMEVLMSAVRWLRFDWKGRAKHLVNLMKCVRFGWIEPWQLIDVKRNPENPEFIAIMKNPEVLRMVDDGLAFVIIKYWYGHKNDDFQHWLDLLGLEEPAHRNLSGSDKNYVTYRQFLEYLDTYRNDAIIEKTMPKSQKRAIDPAHSKVTTRPDIADILKKQPIPTMDEMLASRKIAYDIPGDSFSSAPSCNRSGDGPISPIASSLKSHDVKSMFSKSTKKGKTSEKSDKKDENETSTKTNTVKDERALKLMSTLTKGTPVPPSEQRDIKVMSVYETTTTGLPEGKPLKNELSHSVLGPQNKNYLNKGSLFAADRETVLVFGGIDPHSQYGIGRNTGKDVYRYVPESNRWEFVTELPEPRHHHAVVFMKGRVYLVGGADPRDDEIRGKSVVVSTVWSFEPVCRAWFSETGMHIPRKNLGLVVNRQKMYAIGGQDRMGRVLSSVERYEPMSGTWEEIAPLNSPRMGIACTKYRDYIWVAGGMTGSKKNPLSNNVECYDIRTNEWTEISSLRFPRCFGRMFAMNDKLYLIGGAGRMSDKDKTTTSVEAIDVWDTKEKEWRLQSEMAIPRHGHAVAYIGTQIMMIGGVTTVYMRALSNVECYCVERNVWVRGVATLPTTLSGHGAVTLPPASLL